MIAPLLEASRLTLRRDRVAQIMAFVLPVAFFSIFAMIFGRPQSSATSRIDVAVVDEDHSDMSRYLIAALAADSSLSVIDSVAGGTSGPPRPLDRAGATRDVTGGAVPVAVILPKGWSATFPNLDGTGVRAEVLTDPSDPIARHMIVGLLQRAGSRVLQGGAAAPGTPGAGADGMLVAVNVREVAGEHGRSRNMVAFYAAGVAVMFLLFSASAGGGALLDEQDSGTLERVLNSRVGMTGLLAAKWVHLTLVGVLQITVMFVWAMLVFRLDLIAHLPGFAIMTIATAGAAAAFGLVLATLCRTRQQLSGISTLVILTMSALGGSMFPRFLMSEGMQRIGLFTFNAWALDGFTKVFWRDAPITALAPQVGVLLAFAAVFLTLARVSARRWERA